MSITHSEILELASELAHDKTEEELLASGAIQDEEDMYCDDNGNKVYNESTQDLFNIHYDYFFDKISEILTIEN